jgi:hypothetical protein
MYIKGCVNLIALTAGTATLAPHVKRRWNQNYAFGDIVNTVTTAYYSGTPEQQAN